MSIISMEAIILFSICSSSLLMIKIYQRAACQLGFYDAPNDRSSHTKPIPLGAGLTFALCLSPAIFYLRHTGFLTSDSFYLLIGGSCLITLLGFVDDIRHLSAKFRLLIQFILSVSTLVYLTDFLTIPFQVKFLPFEIPVISFLFGVLFVMWMINLFNFMDGLDGLLGSQVFIYGLTSYFLCNWSGNTSLGFIYLLLSALTLPFLVFNWRPAKLFMGDAGAYFFGFSFAFLGLLGKIEFNQSLVAQVVLMGAVISDATYTLVYRFFTTGNCLGAHRSHIFQILRDKIELRISRIVTLYLIVTFSWFVPISILTIIYPENSIKLCFLGYAPSLIFFFKSRKWQKKRLTQ